MSEPCHRTMAIELTCYHIQTEKRVVCELNAEFRGRALQIGTCGCRSLVGVNAIDIVCNGGYGSAVSVR